MNVATVVKKKALLQVRISQRERRRWAEAARCDGVTLSEMVRQAVRYWIRGGR